MFLEIVCSLLFLYFILQLYWNRLTKPWQHLQSIPSKCYPLLGHIPTLASQKSDAVFVTDLHRWIADSDNDSVLLWVATNPTIFTGNVNVFKELLYNSKHTNKSNSYWTFKEWLKEALFTSSGTLWRKRRKLLTPSFHFNILLDFLPIIERHSKDFITCLKGYAEQERVFDAFKVMKLYSVGIICETAMGIECNALSTLLSTGDGNNPSLEACDLREELNYVQCIDRLMDLIFIRYKIPWYWPKSLFLCFPSGQEYYKKLNTVENFVTKVIKKRIQKLNEDNTTSTNSKTTIFLDKILAHFNDGNLNIDDVVSETHTFMFAGYDTVATALSWCLYMLGRNKDTQQKAYEEAKYVHSQGLCLKETLKELKYVECVVKESLRLHPSIPIIARVLEEDVEIDSILYPKGTDFALCVHELHRNPKIWENPLAFKPERFLPQQTEESDKMKPKENMNFSYVPFAAGPRNCIGQKFALMELKTTLYQILLNYEISALQREEELLEHVAVVHGVLNEEGLQIKFKLRM